MATFVHLTSAKLLRRILRAGIKPAATGSGYTGVFATNPLAQTAYVYFTVIPERSQIPGGRPDAYPTGRLDC